MTTEAPSRSSGTVVLAFDSALALFADGIPDDRAMRDRAATAALRQAVGRQDILIERRESGRPRLRAPYPELGVSMAGRGDVLLIGFSPDARVGVDLEPEESVPIADVARLAADHFSIEEARAIRSAGADMRARDLFLRLWVAKEAALKLTGRGVFDGVGEPEFSTQLDRLLIDDAVIDAPSSSAHPQFRVAVRRVMGERDARDIGRPPVTHYCALAVCAA